jgi:dCMP deaminase
LNTTSEDREHLRLSEQVGQQSNCVSRHVGCVIVKGTAVLSAGWNGVHTSPELDCVAGGCPRCRLAETVTGIGYDRCICIHAEQFAIAVAAREGISLKGATLYSTLRPCLTCAGNALAAGIERVVYDRDWHYEDYELERAHDRIRQQFAEFGQAADAIAVRVPLRN